MDEGSIGESGTDLPRGPRSLDIFERLTKKGGSDLVVNEQGDLKVYRKKKKKKRLYYHQISIILL